MNKVILKGRLAKDPEVRYTQSGKATATFSVAVDRRYKQGEQRQADFIPCVAWEKLAETCGNYLSKGKEVLVEGRMQVRSYDGQDGKKRYITEVVLNSLEFCGSKDGGNSGTTPPPPPPDGGTWSSEGTDIPF